MTTTVTSKVYLLHNMAERLKTLNVIHGMFKWYLLDMYTLHSCTLMIIIGTHSLSLHMMLHVI